MNRILKQGMKEMLVKLLMEYQNEEHKDIATIEHYAENYADNYERYLQAYHEFKEEK